MSMRMPETPLSMISLSLGRNTADHFPQHGSTALIPPEKPIS